MCPLKWIVFAIAAVGYFLVVRLMVIVPLLSWRMLSSMRRCLVRSVLAAMRDQPANYEKCMEERLEDIDKYTQIIDKFEAKLKNFAAALLGDCQ